VKIRAKFFELPKDYQGDKELAIEVSEESTGKLPLIGGDK
jgi:hypothetical protein